MCKQVAKDLQGVSSFTATVKERYLVKFKLSTGHSIGTFLLFQTDSLSFVIILLNKAMQS